jgi:hypothetical protein
MRRQPGQFLLGAWPCAAALGVLGLAVAVLLRGALARCGGHLVYPLDDTYIHMALACNLAGHGVWGISATGFSSCTSSLLWPLALAGSFLLAGARNWLPLLLNSLCAAGLLIWLGRLHARERHPGWFVFLSLGAVALLAPLPSTLLLGMEHVMHALLAVAFASVAARRLAGEESGWSAEWGLWLLAPLIATVRYEGIFLLAVACFLFLCRRRWRLAFGLGGWGLLPIVLFGCLARTQGFHFFPNSVLMKAGLTGGVVNFPALTWHVAVGHMIDARPLLVPFVATLAVVAVRLRRRTDPWEPGILFGALYIFSFLPQYATIQPSLFGRYDVYHIAFGLAAFFLNLPAALATFDRARLFSRAALLPALGACVLLPFFAPMVKNFALRAYVMALMVRPGAGNIYEQQYQMGRFLKTYYTGAGVAANDIGAVCYYGGIDCLDLFGLASAEVLDARRAGRFDAATVGRLAAQSKVKVAVFYESWVGEAIPPAWKKAGAWTIRDGCVCGNETVSFYAADPAEFERLKTHLREFSVRLPRTVTQQGEYLAAPGLTPAP